MSSITITISLGPHQRAFRFEEHTAAYQALTLIIERLNPILPAQLVRGNCGIRIPSAETPSGEALDGIRISKMVDERQVRVRLLDQDGQQIEADRGLLDRVVLVPSADQPARIIMQANTGETPQLSAQDAPTDQTPGARLDFTDKIHVEMPSDRVALASGPQAEGIKIKVWEAALRKARSHALSHRDHEVGGICIGLWGKDRQSKQWIVEITDTLVGEHTIDSAASITFTPDTWSAANRIIDRDYAANGEGMAGWYHTHPGFGVFLSSYDLFIHENFFTQPWHVALVNDPLRGDEGFFVWDAAAKAVQRYPNDQLEILKGSYPRPAAVEKPATDTRAAGPAGSGPAPADAAASPDERAPTATPTATKAAPPAEGNGAAGTGKTGEVRSP